MQKITIQDAVKLPKIDTKEAEEILAFVIKKDRTFIKSHKDDLIDTSDYKKFQRLTMRRLKNEPLSYIIGSQPFCGSDFKVNPNVLIPRPETEYLVELILKNIKDTKVGEGEKQNLNKSGKELVVDIGTGSGCIACSISKALPDTQVIASDISEKALSVVKYNNRKLSTGVKVIHSNLLDKKLINFIKKEIDSTKDNVLTRITIVANLPYLPSSDAKTMQKDVVDYEPHLALFAGTDGLKLIKKLLLQIKNLKKFTKNQKITIWFEVDPRQIAPLLEYAKKTHNGAKIKVYKDLFGRKRFVRIVIN
ncbi:peptide chain release factor N(5)-glutamine methyltransferase [Patescibacteria group bacterium]|nr:peptide chain release factor N(5)-glutamine methyltransferase [Patescibacteria group bacterium]